jgi:hypothetical protein
MVVVKTQEEADCCAAGCEVAHLLKLGNNTKNWNAQRRREEEVNLSGLLVSPRTI